MKRFIIDEALHQSGGRLIAWGEPDADYVGALAQTWPDWHETFGTYYHLIPVCKFPGAGQ